MIDYFEEDDRFYMVNEKMEGGSLSDRIGFRSPVTEVEAREVIRGIASSLRFLHENGIAHRNIKPENILCVSSAHIYSIEICDFDIASRVQTDNGLSSRPSCKFVSNPNLHSPVGTVQGWITGIA